MAKIIQAQPLRELVASIVKAGGSSDAEAKTVADNLVMANLSGHDSHGVGMIPRYIDAVLEGGLVPNTSVKAVMDIGTMLTLDAQRGYGQVVAGQAMEMGIARPRLVIAHTPGLGGAVIGDGTEAVRCRRLLCSFNRNCHH